jgi:ATP-dependent Zn protease
MDENIIIASHHEAGHAIMAYVVGWNISSIELLIENGILKMGVTNYEFGEDNLEDFVNLNRRIHALIGGPIAEIFFRGESHIDLDLLGVDGVRIDELLKTDLNKDNTIQAAINLTATFLNFPNCKSAINEIAQILIETSSLSKEHFNMIMQKHKVHQMNFG